MLRALTVVSPVIDHDVVVIVAAFGTLQEVVPVSIVPPEDAKVLTTSPVTGAVDIGFLIPVAVKLNVPDDAVVRIPVSVSSCVEVE